MTQDQGWATARVLAKALGRDHFVAESIHHPGLFLVLDEAQYNVLRGRNWIKYYQIRTDGSVDA